MSINNTFICNMDLSSVMQLIDGPRYLCMLYEYLNKLIWYVETVLNADVHIPPKNHSI